MVDGNLTGYGQHKFKSINVEANLLDSWIDDRKSLEQATRKSVAALLVVCTLGAVIIPLTWTLKSGISYDANNSQKKLATLVSKRDELKQKADLLVPQTTYSEGTSKENGYSRTLLFETARVINSAPENLVFQSLKVEVLFGELTIRVTADAKNSKLGRIFVNRASKGSKVIDSLQTGVRKSTSLGSESVSFDFIKKIGLEK